MTGNSDMSTDEISFELFGRKVTVSSASIQGRRKENQDCIGWFAITPEGNFGSVDKELKGQEMLFCALCDGMGGMRDGAAASSTVIKALMDWVPGYSGSMDGLYLGMVNVLRDAEESLVKYHSGSGTTLVVLVFFDGHWYSIHLGDSRCYVATEDGVERTYDHAPVDEMFKRGLIDEDEALSHPMKNIISGYVGAEDSYLDKMEMNVRSEPGTVILCSDGAYGCMKESEFMSICKGNPADVIVRRCYEAGSTDNISVIKVSVSEL